MVQTPPPDMMLLAAGLGTRLRPLTETVPKPLVTVGGTALIDRVIANARAEGFSRFVVNAHYLADLLAAHVEALATSRPECRFRLSREQALLDTGGGVRRALPLLDTDPVLVSNTDAFWPADIDRPLARLLEAFDPARADIAVLCADPNRASGFRRSHDFCRAPDGRITRDRGRPVIYAGVMLIARRALEAMSEGAFSLLVPMQKALAEGRMVGAVLDAPWLHVGDPEALAEAEAALAMVPA